MTPVLGADGCRNGWIGARCDGAGVELLWGADLRSLVEAAGPVQTIGVDIPIDLPVDAPRACESLARARLGPLRSSVFPVPMREALESADWAEANAVNRRLSGRGLSKQSWALAPAIRDAQSFVAAHPSTPVAEVHPELVFATLHGGPLPWSKKTAEGQRLRLDLLAGVGLAVDPTTRPIGAKASADDLVDAAAVAWTARRLADGTAERLPAEPRADMSPAIWV